LQKKERGCERVVCAYESKKLRVLLQRPGGELKQISFSCARIKFLNLKKEKKQRPYFFEKATEKRRALLEVSHAHQKN